MINDKSDDQLIILSLLSNLECENIDKEIEHLKESSELHKNKDKILNIISNIDKNKLKSCMYCSTIFSKISDLRKHILIKCFYKELDKENKTKELMFNINNSNNNTINSNNISNTNSNNTTQNITNIYLEIKNPIPFDKEWDISKISIEKLSDLLLSKIMYTGLLEEILKNEINLNVIIDKNNDSGMVYKNDCDKYIHMKSKDIVDNTMTKLKKHFIDIGINKTKSLYLDEPLNLCLKIAEKKYNEYLINSELSSIVKEHITNIYATKKNNAIDMSKNIIDNNIKNDIENGYF